MYFFMVDYWIFLVVFRAHSDTVHAAKLHRFADSVNTYPLSIS